jgi:hypothetical protein
MSILSKIFNIRAKNQETIVSEPEKTLVEQSQESIPPVDLFIDNEPPTIGQQFQTESQSKITSFLNRNYHSMGTNDGYEYHSQETLETGKKKIRASFQLMLDQEIQEKSDRRLQLKNMIVDVAKVSDETRQKLENTFEELNISINKLQKQKELSIENEGWVMNAIHGYHQGFVQGLNDYIAGENLLMSIKNL